MTLSALHADIAARIAKERERCRLKSIVYRQKYPDREKASKKRHYLKHHESKLRYAQERREANRRYLDQILLNSSCCKCGESDFRCLRFHHIDPASKFLELPQLVAYARKRIDDELTKCEVVCANCHVKAHELDGKVLFRGTKKVKVGVPKSTKVNGPVGISEEKREYNRQYYEANKASMNERSRAGSRLKYQENMQKVKEIKQESGCIKCGKNDPNLLQFHHRNPEDKLREIPALCGFAGARLMAEIAKCDIMCANCHAKGHYRSNRITPKLRKKIAQQELPFEDVG